MKKLLLLGGLLFAIASPVYAGSPAPIWTGFYVGGNAGYGWAKASNDWNVFNQTTSLVTDCSTSTHLGGGNAFCVNGNDSGSLRGVIGGLQAGYNWQFGKIVTGAVTDFQFSGQQASNSFSAIFPINSDGGTFSAASTEKLSWLGTFRGKLGLTADRSLFYATGGLAYGRVNVSGTATATVDLLVNSPPMPFGSWNRGTTKAGWTIGAGMEQSIDRNWSLMVEYLYVDLGTVSTSFVTPGGNPGQFNNASMSLLPGTGTISSRLTDNIVRFGINYKLN